MSACCETEHPPESRGTSATEFVVTGMNCDSCVRHVREAISAVPGVDRVEVNLSARHASVHWRADAAPSAEPIVRAVHEAGFNAEPATISSEPAQSPSAWSPLDGWRFNAVVGSAVTLPLIIGEWVFNLGMVHWFQWLAFGLAIPVQTICGARFYRGAWNQLKAGKSNMDTLVALGSTTAFVYSACGLLAGWHAHLYFMEAAAIITLISLGHWLEARMSVKAAGSLKALLNLAPQTARKLCSGGQENEVPVSSLKIGDRIILKPGDRVPTDGEVTEGASAVDESMLTGESLPVEKSAGSKLYAGTVNQNGRLVVQVAATGESTALAQIIAVVQHAQTSRASIQKLGDQVSNVFVPTVVVVALAAGLWWGLAYPSALKLGAALIPYLWSVHFPATALAAAVIHAAAVLIVACPCAMGLATPAAIMAGTNAAARRGILIRDGAALEKTGTITAVLFDKTGTLTEGKVSVAASEDLRGASERSIPIQEIAASLAQPSNHPLSRALAQLARPDPAGAPAAPAIVLADWQEVRGSGVQATSGNTLLRLGSLNWLRESGVDLASSNSFTAAWFGKGATVLGLARDRQLIGVLALGDHLKPHAAEVMTALRQQGKATYLITGDNQATAAAIAQQAGIPPANVFAEVRPEKKAEIVRQLQQRGERVAFVGDGINDAPALEQADLGIAVAKASDVAREAADIILLKSDIQAIPEALGLAQATLRTIKQNLFWAFFYNALGIPLAALGFLSPVLCAAAMGFSDVIVIGNALRLRNWKPYSFKRSSRPKSAAVILPEASTSR